MFLRGVPAGVRDAVAAAARAKFRLDPDPDWPREPDALGAAPHRRPPCVRGAKMWRATGPARSRPTSARRPGTSSLPPMRWRPGGRRVFGAEHRTAAAGLDSRPPRLRRAHRDRGRRPTASRRCSRAPRYAEGRLDWYAFDAAPADANSSPPRVPPPDPDRPLSFVPTAASFPGMPNPRFWEMEDRRINFGSLNAKTTDHLLLIFAEMGLVYGNDWLSSRSRCRSTTLCEVLGLVVTDVFGDRTLVPPANAPAENIWQRWSFFSVTGESRDDWRGRFFWLPASLTSVDQSEPLEAVSFARDEMANLAWAVEDVIPDGTGKGIETRLLIPDEPPPPPTLAGVRYTLGTTVPENWVPFLPEHLPGSITDIRLRRGAMPPHGTRRCRRGGAACCSTSAGAVLCRGGGSARLRHHRFAPGATGALVRRADLLWIGRARETGRGSAASGLSFDQIDDVPPSP